MTDSGNVKRCERCRAEFNCGATEGSCWCFDVKVTPDARIEMGKNFADCLCEGCLRVYADFKSTD